MNLWSLLCLVIGVFGQTGYIADALQTYLSAWQVVPVLILPAALVIFVQPNEIPKVWVRRIHVFAAIWYVCITIAIELSGFFGYSPHGATFFRILVHIGWLQFAPLLKIW